MLRGVSLPVLPSRTRNVHSEVQNRISSEHAKYAALVLAPVILPLLVKAETDQNSLREKDRRPAVCDPVTAGRIAISTDIHALGGIVTLYTSVSVGIFLGGRTDYRSAQGVAWHRLL